MQRMEVENVIFFKYWKGPRAGTFAFAASPVVRFFFFHSFVFVLCHIHLLVGVRRLVGFIQKMLTYAESKMHEHQPRNGFGVDVWCRWLHTTEQAILLFTIAPYVNRRTHVYCSQPWVQISKIKQEKKKTSFGSEMHGCVSEPNERQQCTLSGNEDAHSKYACAFIIAQYTFSVRINLYRMIFGASVDGCLRYMFASCTQFTIHSIYLMYFYILFIPFDSTNVFIPTQSPTSQSLTPTTTEEKTQNKKTQKKMCVNIEMIKGMARASSDGIQPSSTEPTTRYWDYKMFAFRYLQSESRACVHISSLSFVIFPFSISTSAPSFAPACVCVRLHLRLMIPNLELSECDTKTYSKWIPFTHSTQRTHTWLEFLNILSSGIVLLCDECRWQFFHNATIIESFNQHKYWHNQNALLSCTNPFCFQFNTQ